MRKLLLSAICSLFIISSVVFASGFQINETGAKAMAMGGAFTGLANDASAVFFNPGGITQLQGTHFYGGVSLIAPITEFTGPTPSTSTYKVKAKVFFPFNIYFTHQLSEKAFIGFSVNNPFGLGTQWEDTNWPGRYLAEDTEIRTFYFTPTFAYKINEQFSIGAGITFAYGDVIIKKKTPLADPVTHEVKPDALIELEGDGTSWGFNVGLLWKPTKQFQIGLDYRSENKFEFEGTATTTPATLDFVHPQAGNQSVPLPTGDITAPLTTPQNIVLGLAYLPNNDLTITADFQYVGWKSYDKLEVTFKNYKFSDGTNISSVKRDYQNSYIARLGCEYKLNDVAALRGGFLYDKNPVKDEYVEPTLPDADRLGFNIGLGYKLTKDLSIDVAYFFLYFMEREITNSENLTVPGVTAYGYFNGTYKPYAHLFGINFSYSL